LVGAMGWFVPQTLGVGYKYVGDSLNGGMALKLMVLLLVLKLFAVTVSYASGNAGGIFGPSLFIGAMLGGIVGTVAQKVSPGHVAAPGAYALVGMGTAFAGIVRAPMTSVVMIFETTRDYAVIVPLMISNLVSLFISSRFQPKPIYEVLAEQDGIHLPTAETRSQDGQRRVARAMRAVTESPEVSLTVHAAIEKAGGSASQSWLIVNKQRLQGVVSLEMLKKAALNGDGTETLAKLVDGHFPHVHVDQPLSLALERMRAAHLDVLPVVSRADVHRLEGMVTLQDVLSFYGFGGTISSS
jgi:CIC family chloride channel protein